MYGISSKARRFAEPLVRELEQAGARDIFIENSGKHPKLRFTTRDGERRFYAFAGTPSDSRAPMRARADLRRMLRREGEIAR